MADLAADEDCACLHRQITEWVMCPHSHKHLDLTEAVIHMVGSSDPASIEAIRSATVRRSPIGREALAGR